MAIVTKYDIKNALSESGIQQGDMVVFHSSLKSFGTVDGGADAVIDAFLESVGDTGTVIAPTLSQKNFADAYKTWHIDKPSDVGLITEVFRKRDGALRSNQATHSVAAIGKKAKYLTETHGQSGQRYGAFGSTPFSEDSPWQKMFDENAKVVLIGVDFNKLTFRHLFEYTLVSEVLEKAKERGEYDTVIKNIRCFDDYPRRSDTYFWPLIGPELTEFASDYCKEVKCGDSVIKCLNIKPFGDDIMNDIRKNPEKWWEGNVLKWMTQYN